MSRIVFSMLSIISLILCLASPFLYFLGNISGEKYKWMFFLASVSWFIFATLWASKRKKVSKPGE